MPPVQSSQTTCSILEDLPFCLARATLGFRRFNDLTLRAIDLASLAPGAASILHALQEEPSCTVNRLVEKTHLPNGTLTGLLDELQEAAETPWLGHGGFWRNADRSRTSRTSSAIGQGHAVHACVPGLIPFGLR